MNHFTDTTGYDAIRSQPIWTFRAAKPPGEHPRGAYFTTLDVNEPKLAQRLRIPRAKLAYYLSFVGAEGLVPLRGGRGEYIYSSVDDYTVGVERQTGHGERP